MKANPVRKRERVLEPIRTFLGISQKKKIMKYFQEVLYCAPRSRGRRSSSC